MGFWRRRQESERQSALTQDAAHALGIAKDEQILAWAPLSAGAGYVGLTRTHLHVAVSGSDVLHIEWHLVEYATWEDPVLIAVVQRDDQQLRVAMELAAAGFVPQVLRERVSATVAHDSYQYFADGRRVRLVARRSVITGDTAWSMRFDEAEPDEQLRVAAEQRLREVRADLGL